MTTSVRSAVLWCACLTLAVGLSACGGGGGVSVNTGYSTTTSTSTATTVVNPISTAAITTSTTGLLLTGIAYPLKANDSVHVPAGAQITSTNGAVTTINASSGSINVPGGSIIMVPSTATGSATFLVTTLASVPYGVSTVLPTVNSVAGAAAATAASPPVDGDGAAARFWGGGHLALDSVGNLFMSDGGALKQISFTGTVRTLATGYLPYDWEGIALGANGTVYGSGTSYAPPPNNYGASLQSLNTLGALSTVVSNWTASATVTILGYGGLAVDAAGNLFLTDARNHRILKFTPAGAMSVFAGSGSTGTADGAGTAASFNNPTDLAMDGKGNIFVSDTGNSTIRKITAAGVTTTVTKQLSPGAIASTPAGVVFFIGGSPRTLFRISQDLNFAVSFPLPGVTDAITGLAADSVGNVYAGTLGIGAQIFRLNGF